MISNVLSQSTNSSTNIPTSFCGGETWAAVQSLVAFVVTNVIAHAATILLPNGGDRYLNIVSVLKALVLPVNAGDYAFHLLSRWGARLRAGHIEDVLPGDKFEDAATSGAIAISIPLQFVPLVHGYWDPVDDRQTILMLNNSHFRNNKSSIKQQHNLPFKVDDKFPRYVPYLLPASTRFPSFQNFTLSPTSSALSQVIAVFQVILSSRQLFIQYESSILTHGLSSPYLVVIPYLLMSLVNLVTNILVGSYTHVTMLPMACDQLPEINEVYIAAWPKLRVFSFGIKEHISGNSMIASENGILSVQESTGSTPIGDGTIRNRQNVQSEHSSRNASEIHNSPSGEVTSMAVIENVSGSVVLDGESPLSQHQRSPIIEEFDGKNWIQSSLQQRGHAAPAESMEEEAFMTKTPILNIWRFHFYHTDRWSSVCHEMRWRWWLGKTKNRPREHETPVNESKKKGVLFWRVLTAIGGWNFMIRKNPSNEEIAQFKTWSEANYPGIEIPFENRRKRIGDSTLVSGIFLQLLVTIILGSLTHFYLGSRNRGPWLLVWMYGGPSLRWWWFVKHFTDTEPTISLLKHGLRVLSVVSTIVIMIGLYGGITVIAVELFEASCGTPISLSPGGWILVGFLIAIASGLLGGAIWLSWSLFGNISILSLLMFPDVLRRLSARSRAQNEVTMVNRPAFAV